MIRLPSHHQRMYLKRESRVFSELASILQSAQHLEYDPGSGLVEVEEHVFGNSDCPKCRLEKALTAAYATGKTYLGG